MSLTTTSEVTGPSLPPSRERAVLGMSPVLEHSLLPSPSVHLEPPAAGLPSPKAGCHTVPHRPAYFRSGLSGTFSFLLQVLSPLGLRSELTTLGNGMTPAPARPRPAVSTGPRSEERSVRAKGSATRLAESLLGRRTQHSTQVINCRVGVGNLVAAGGLPFSVSRLRSLCPGSRNPHMERAVSHGEVFMFT